MELAAVIFLDVEGVLSSCAGGAEDEDGGHDSSGFDSPCVDALRRIVSGTGASIVLCGASRLAPDRHTAVAAAVEAAQCVVVGETPCLAGDGGEVVAWLKAHHSCRSFVVLEGATCDATAASLLPAGSRVRVGRPGSPSSGLGLDQVAAAVDILRTPRAQEVRERAKLDPAARRFVRFPGVTVVSNVTAASIEYMARLPEVIQRLPILGRCFLPLPASSYHVTLLDINCQMRIGMDDVQYEAMLREPRWPAAAQRIQAADFSPKLVFRQGGLQVNSSVMMLSLQSAQEETPEHPAKWTVGLQVASDLGALPPQQHGWHLTLAYCIEATAFLASDSASIAAEIEEVEAAATACCSQQGATLDLEAARLCRFEDMTAFVPFRV